MFVSRSRLEIMKKRIEELEDCVRLRRYDFIGPPPLLRDVVLGLLDHLKLDAKIEPSKLRGVRLTERKPEKK